MFTALAASSIVRCVSKATMASRFLTTEFFGVAGHLRISEDAGTVAARQGRLRRYQQGPGLPSSD